MCVRVSAADPPLPLSLVLVPVLVPVLVLAAAEERDIDANMTARVASELALVDMTVSLLKK